MWLVVASNKEDSLQIGINPEGAYSVKMIDRAGKELAQGFELEDVECSRKYGGASWRCQVGIFQTSKPGTDEFALLFQS